MDATNLTQLSSREQLSALMDGALPADETRFLLRRLQHDASLAESWERWRLSAEVMRGLAPAQRLPADFAARVAASLGDEAEHDQVLRHEARQQGAVATSAAGGRQVMRSSTWLRWGSGAAVAASLAVVALMNQPAGMGALGTASDANAVAAAISPASVPKEPTPQNFPSAPAGMDIELQAAALASAVAIAARPVRNNRRSNPQGGMQVTSLQTSSGMASITAVQPVEIGVPSTGNIMPLLPQTDIITRPWPRSVLPHDGSTAGFAVGFGDSTSGAAAYNPFKVRTSIGSLAPALIVDLPEGDAATVGDEKAGRAANNAQQP